MMRLFILCCVSAVMTGADSVDDWEALGCFYDHDHSALPEHFYTPSDLDVNDLWPNLKPLAQACSKQAEIRNFKCFGIQYHQECWGGVNASRTYNISGKSRNCKVGVDGYGVGKLYTTFVYKLKSVDGNWGAWSEWTPCSQTCGEGNQKRMRNCTNPAPANGGRPCEGVTMETKKCSLKACPVIPTVCPQKTISGHCCSIPFKYNAVRYNSCTEANHNRFWCSLDPVYKGRWGNCLMSTSTICLKKTTTGQCCSIPFTYQGVKYFACTRANHHRPWCSLDPEYKGRWGNCQV